MRSFRKAQVADAPRTLTISQPPPVLYQAHKGDLKMKNAGNTPNASMEPFQYYVSRNGASRLRRWLMWLVALLVLITAAIVVIGLIPFAPDVPSAGASKANPGGGGILRARPSMNVR